MPRHGSNIKQTPDGRWQASYRATVGGKEIYIDMRGGVRNVSPTKGVSQMPREYRGKATSDVRGRWALLNNPFPDASNVPAWLQTAILDTVQELAAFSHAGSSKKPLFLA